MHGQLLLGATRSSPPRSPTASPRPTSTPSLAAAHRADARSRGVVRRAAEDAAHARWSQAQSQARTRYQKQKGILAEDARLDVESARLAELSTQLLAARNATYDAHQPLQAGDRDRGERRLARGDARRAGERAHQRAQGRPRPRRGRACEQESAVLGPNHPQYLRTAAEVQGLREKLQVRDEEAGRRPGQRGAAERASARRTCRRRSRRRTSACSTLKDCRIEHGGDDPRHRERAALLRRGADALHDQQDRRRARSTTNVALLTPAIEPLKPAHPEGRPDRRPVGGARRCCSPPASCTCSRCSTAACARATTSSRASPCRRSAGFPSGSPRAAGCCRRRCAAARALPHPW